MLCTEALVITAVQQIILIHFMPQHDRRYPAMLTVAYTGVETNPNARCCKTKVALNFCSSHLKTAPMAGYARKKSRHSLLIVQ